MKQTGMNYRKWRDKEIMKMRKKGQTFDVIGSAFEISRQRAQQIYLGLLK